MAFDFKPPYMGVAYYPEDWPEEEIDTDIIKMKQRGINCVRIAEFAWNRLEPSDGEFDFTFFHRVVDKMTAAGIAVIMCTPSCTPPRWFTKRYPEAHAVRENGMVTEHGGRRDMCSNSPVYNTYALRIAEEMAKSFKNEKGVIGWQIDNEIYTGNTGCFCNNCVQKFRLGLKKRFKTIDALNNAWNLGIFSQWYSDFDDIQAPRNAWQNPHLKMAWQIFQNDSHIDFVGRQADALKKYVTVPVGTDVMPVHGMDLRRMHKKLDIVEFNHYNTPEDMFKCVMWMSYLRTIKERPFWNTETATNWNGSTAIGQSIKPEGWCRLNSWLPLALGGEANMYWLWRTHWGGHELMHGAILDTDGRAMHTDSEVIKTAREFELAKDFINSTKVSAKAALHFTSLSWNMFMQQPLVNDNDYGTSMWNRFYAPLAELGVTTDVIDAEEDVEKYKFIFSPMLPCLEDGCVGERMEKWVRNGGIWVVGPMSDIRNSEGARFTDRFYGSLERIMGFERRFAVPDKEDSIAVAFADGTPFAADTWYEVNDCGACEALAYITNGHSALKGKPIILKRRVGKGVIVLLGTFPDRDALKKLLKPLLNEAGICTECAAEGIVAIRRDGLKSGLTVLDIAGKGGKLKLEKPAFDLLTGRKYVDEIELEPYGVAVLEEK